MIDFRAAWLAIKGAWATIRTVLFLALALWFGLFMRSCGRNERAVEVERLKAAHAQALAQSAAELARLASDYRTRERQMGDAFIAATAQNNEDLRRVEHEKQALVAGLLSGNDRLQDRWAGCVSAAGQASGRAGASDAGTRDRAESAGRIVAAAANCDAQVAALQSLLKAERTP